MKEINYRLGLDIGITSVGWSVINIDKNRIEDLGVRIFNAAEHPKTGASLAEPRRLARGRRRLLRRKAYRVERVKNLIIDIGLLNKEELKNLFEDKSVINVWDARIEGLDRLLTNKEFAKILVNFAKRRGFKSNRKNERSNKETGVVISSIESNREKMSETESRTIGEYIYNEVKNSDDKYKSFRNKDGNYNMCVSREMIKEEIDFIFVRQRIFKNEFAGNEIEDRYLEIFESQRPYSDFDALEKFVGYCTFEKKEKRAPKASISAEEFVLYEHLNKLSILNNGEKRKLNEEERNIIIKEAFTKKEIKYSTIRKLLTLQEEDRFSTLTYSIDKDIKKTEDTRFISMKCYYEIKKSIEYGISKEYFNTIKDNRKMLNEIAYVLTLGKTDDEIREQLELRNIPKEVIKSVEDLSFSKFMNLSIKAIEKILPYMKKGYQYNEACELAGYDFKAIYKGEKSKKLPLIDIEEIVNPVVKRSLAQTRKVVNAVIEKYGSPVGINIELARELAKNFKDRKKIEKEQKENRDNREKYRQKILELFGKEPTGAELLKYRLWEEQRGECAYSQRVIGINELMGDGFCEVDHIIPHSRSFDDRLSNKVLVLYTENQNKRNRTPYEYFGNDEERWHRFELWVKGSTLPYRKKLNLLKKKISEDEKKTMKERNLQDTKYICKYIANYINNRLEFKESESKQKVITVNGMATAYLRAKWGLNKVREEGDKHHALDATVVAVATQGMVQKISKHNKARELRNVRKYEEYVDVETGEITKIELYREEFGKHFPRPWMGFSEELRMRLSENPLEELKKSPIETYDGKFIENSVKPIFVSRMAIRKVKGRLFGETIYSKESFKGNKFITKKKLIDLTKSDLDKLYNYNCDKKLYDAIIERMSAYNYNGKKAFAEEFRKPTKEGKLGPVVKSIKIENTVPFKEGVDVKEVNGVVAKDGMVRVDIYFKENKYYSVPVYRYQIANGEVPKKAAVAAKSESEWIEIDETFKFKFSIYKNDLIEIKFLKKDGYFGYYDGFDRSTAAFIIEKHDNSERYRGIGVKVGVKEFSKYEVDMLGNYYKVKERK